MKIPEIRRSEISRLVLENRRESIAHLSETLDVSEETIRRDLYVLHARGHLVKVHGGAVAPDTPGLGTAERRSIQQADEKKRIAVAAKKLFKKGDSLMIDAGSTTDAFAEALSTVPSLTVITNSLQVAQTFWHAGNGHSVILTGGELRLDTAETLGEIALQQLSQFSVDHAVLTIGGIKESGEIMRYRIDEVMIARAMIEHAKNVTILADHTKMLTPALMKICEMEQVTNLVTDRDPPGNLKSLLIDAGTRLIVANLL
ncbi:MAG: DeoR/GlpR family DNA-binding transcription regulator [bacterium]